MLKKSGCGTYINSLYTGNPTQADDLALLSTMPKGLQSMINITYNYSQKWRYDLSVPKTKIMIFKSKPNQCLGTLFPWKLGDDAIEVVKTYKHVGVILSANLSSAERSDSAAKAMRSKFISAVGQGIRPSGINPLTAYKILHKVVLPSVLFGCELWSSLTQNEYEKLERSYRFCLKFALGIHMRTHTFTVYSLLGAKMLQDYIHEKQLSFFRRLAELPPDSVAYNTFMQRLMSYSLGCAQQPRGFITSTVNLMDRYGLIDFLNNFMCETVFPSKKPWSAIVRNTVQVKNTITLDNHLSSQCKTISMFTHRGKGLPSNLLMALNSYPDIKKEIMFMIKLAAHPTVVDNPKCLMCNNTYDSLALHYLCTCESIQERREAFWEVATNLFDIRLSALLNNLPDENFTSVLLGGVMPEFNEIFQEYTEYYFFLKCAAKLFYHKGYKFEVQYT